MSNLGNFVWGIAYQRREVYELHGFGGGTLALTILRRLDCVQDPACDGLRFRARKSSGGALEGLEQVVAR